MRGVVDDVIALRSPDPGGLRKMISWSFAIHISALVLFVAVPRSWFVRPTSKPNVMTISLGGTLGPRSTGTTPVSARPVETVAPEPKRPTPIAPAASKPDVMTVPEKAPAKPPKPEVKTTPAPLPTPVTRPPTTGRAVQQGISAAETFARGQGPGLTVGGGGGGAQLRVDTDFCCQAYLVDVVNRISGVWRSIQPEHGTTIMTFTIMRDGSITGIVVETSSGSSLLDRLSKATLMDPSLKFQPLPAEYTPDHLTIHLSFPYQGPEL